MVDWRLDQDQSKGGPRGHDAHMQVTGGRRQLLVDAQGFALNAVVSVADALDRDGVRLVAQCGSLGRCWRA